MCLKLFVLVHQGYNFLALSRQVSSAFLFALTRAAGFFALDEFNLSDEQALATVAALSPLRRASLTLSLGITYPLE